MAKIYVTDIYTPEQIAFYAAKFHAGVDGQDTTDVAYFVQKGEGGPIKIGYTNCIKARMRSLKTAHGKECILLATRRGGMDREGAYHFQFAADFIGKEWFEPSPAILAEIERLSDES
ncbi:MAG: GIY-YIG nuclease family protein [Pseudomonadota bacterium]